MEEKFNQIDLKIDSFSLILRGIQRHDLGT